MVIRFILAFALFLVVSQTVNAQRLITGKVQDLNTKEKIDQVDIAIYKGTATTTTNKYGYFQLTVKEGDSLLITHPDYKVGLISIPEVDVFSVFIEKNQNYPVYLNGEVELYTYLQKNIKYPRAARNRNIEGMLLIVVDVDSRGNLLNCKALNELGGNCAKEAIEVFRGIPGKWSEANEIKHFIFPVIFNMDLIKKKFDVPDVTIPEAKVMKRVFITAVSSTSVN